MFDDIKELIDQAALPADHAHRDELWQQFQQDAQRAAPTVLRTALPQPVATPSDTIILEKITVAEELVSRRNRRRRYGMLAAAAALLALAGIAAANRGSSTLQVAPAAPTSPTIVNGDETSRAPLAPQSTEPPTTAAAAVTTTLGPTVASTFAPTTISASTTAPLTTLPATTSPVTTVPKPASTVRTPSTQSVEVVTPVGGNGNDPGRMYSRGKWDGKDFVDSNEQASAGRYQNLHGDTFEIDATGHETEWVGSAQPGTYESRPVYDFGFSATPWVAQPRAARPQGDMEALKDARFDVYRDEARRLANKQGAGWIMPVLSSVVRVDLDGDGTEEVLVAASFRTVALDPTPAGPDSERGSYSIVYVRHVVGKTTTAKVLSIVVAKDGPKLVPELSVLGAADLNGDGIMEVFGFSDGHWEGWGSIVCWDAGSSDREPKVLF